MALNILAIDDEFPALQIIEHFAADLDVIDHLHCTTSVSQAFDYLDEHSVDLVLLDIEMPDLDGLSFASKLPDPVKVIFTTAFEQYAVKGYELNVVDYLLKPFTKQRFLTAIEKAHQLIAMEQLQREQDHFIVVQANYSKHKLNCKDIVYIESINNNITIHLDNGQSITFRRALKDLYADLPDNQFVRIHRSFLVPIKRVTSFTKVSVSMDQIELPIGVSYSEEIIKLLEAL